MTNRVEFVPSKAFGETAIQRDSVPDLEKAIFLGFWVLAILIAVLAYQGTTQRTKIEYGSPSQFSSPGTSAITPAPGFGSHETGAESGQGPSSVGGNGVGSMQNNGSGAGVGPNQ